MVSIIFIYSFIDCWGWSWTWSSSSCQIKWNDVRSELGIDHILLSSFLPTPILRLWVVCNFFFKWWLPPLQNPFSFLSSQLPFFPTWAVSPIPGYLWVCAWLFSSVHKYNIVKTTSPLSFLPFMWKQCQSKERGWKGRRERVLTLLAIGKEEVRNKNRAL